MMVRTVLSFILPCLLLLFMMPIAANAQIAENPYVVKDVSVDILAQSAVKARNQAFSEAQGKAFKILAARFMDEARLAGFQSPDPNTIAGMVADFEITNEQLSQRRYLGTYIFRFKESAVYRYFGHGPLAGSSVTSGTAPDLMVVPVFINGGKPVLWDANKNPWLKLWQQDKTANVIVPLGDTSDMIDAKEAEMPKMNRVGLRRIKARYGVNDVVIAVAVFDASAKPPLKIDLYRTDLQETKLAQSLPVEVTTEKKLGELMGKALAQTKAALTANWKVEDVAQIVNVDDETTTEALPSAQTPDTAAPSISSGKAKASIRFNSMAEWLTIRRSLNGVPGLRAMRIASLTTNQADLDLDYANLQTLTAGLASHGLSLIPTGPSSYSLVHRQLLQGPR